MKKKFSGALPFKATLILMMLAAPCLMGAAGTMSAETQRVQQQKHTIKGVVVDEVGEPLARKALEAMQPVPFSSFPILVTMPRR